MPEKLKKMIGVLVLVCTIGGVSCVGAINAMFDGDPDSESKVRVIE